MPRPDRERLEDIASACGAVARFVGSRDEAAFVADELVRSAVCWQLLVIGEAAKAVSPETRAARPQIDWPGVTGFRDVLAHEYFRLSWPRIWAAAALNVSELAVQIREVLDSYEAEEAAEKEPS
jgi:uncharacterized protein with HEPN domain